MIPHQDRKRANTFKNKAEEVAPDLSKLNKKPETNLTSKTGRERVPIYHKLNSSLVELYQKHPIVVATNSINHVVRLIFKNSKDSLGAITVGGSTNTGGSTMGMTPAQVK